jgi:RHS repeat-associated protein
VAGWTGVGLDPFTPAGASNYLESGQTVSDNRLRIQGSTYDDLGRLKTAVTADVGPQWGNEFVYDGFGNLLQKNATKGSAPALSIQVNGTTNRQVGVSYDLNGNVANDGRAYTWDIENRLVAAATVNGPEEHGYGADNRRLWRKKPDGTIEVYLYGPDGMLLGVYNPGTYGPADGSVVGYFEPGKTKYWLGSRLLLETAHKDSVGNWLVVESGSVVWQDRLGSVVKRGGTTYKYFAWGEERTTGQTLTGKEQFGTYLRSDQTGLDYAVNRWYSNAQGRFMGADPYQASGGAADPGSWNRYGYVQGDPVNFGDRDGAVKCHVSGSIGGWTVTCETAYGKTYDNTLLAPFLGSPGFDLAAAAERSWGRDLERRDFQDEMRSQAKVAINSLSKNCQDVLGGHWTIHGPDSLMSKVDHVSFHDARQSYVHEKTLSAWNIRGGGTVSDLFKANPRILAFMSNYNGHPSSDVIVGPQFFGQPLAVRNIGLVHEVLHAYTGKDDMDIALELGIGGYVTNEFASVPSLKCLYTS